MKPCVDQRAVVLERALGDVELRARRCGRSARPGAAASRTRCVSSWPIDLAGLHGVAFAHRQRLDLGRDLGLDDRAVRPPSARPRSRACRTQLGLARDDHVARRPGRARAARSPGADAAASAARRLCTRAQRDARRSVQRPARPIASSIQRFIASRSSSARRARPGAPRRPCSTRSIMRFDHAPSGRAAKPVEQAPSECLFSAQQHHRRDQRVHDLRHVRHRRNSPRSMPRCDHAAEQLVRRA